MAVTGGCACPLLSGSRNCRLLVPQVQQIQSFRRHPSPKFEGDAGPSEHVFDRFPSLLGHRPGRNAAEAIAATQLQTSSTHTRAYSELKEDGQIYVHQVSLHNQTVVQ